MATGDITEKDSLTRTDVGTSGRWCRAIGSYWILVYDTDGSNNVTVETYLIDSVTGDIGSLVDSQIFTELYGATAFAKHIAEGVVAIWGLDGTTVGGDGKVITVSISSSGIISSTILGSQVWKVVDDAAEAAGFFNDAVNTSGTYWAFPFRFGVFNGSWAYSWRLVVVSISVDGATLSVTDDNEILAAGDYISSNSSNIKAVSGTVFAVAIDSGKVITVDINTSGVITNDRLDLTSFGGTRPWIERLDNNWWVLAHEVTSNWKLGSFKINDAGGIDGALTDDSQFLSSVSGRPTVIGLGGLETPYVVVGVMNSAVDAFLIVCSYDVAGTMTAVNTLTWESVLSMYSGSMVKVAYNMFLVEGDTSSGKDIYSETIQVEAPVSSFPSDPLARVTGIIHRRSEGEDTMEVSLGGLSASFGVPRASATPEEVIPEEPVTVFIVSGPHLWRGAGGEIFGWFWEMSDGTRRYHSSSEGSVLTP